MIDEGDRKEQAVCEKRWDFFSNKLKLSFIFNDNGGRENKFLIKQV